MLNAVLSFDLLLFVVREAQHLNPGEIKFTSISYSVAEKGHI